MTRSGQITRLELGKHTSAAVVTGVMAAAPPPVVATSTPSLPTVEASSTPSLQVANQHAGGAKQLLQKYPAVVGASKRLPPVKHAVEHLIETTVARPVASCYRCLDPERLAAAKAEFAAMESQGIIPRSKSSWSSPLHMVEKTDSSWRPCGNYRLLNLVTKRDMYPPPHMEDLSAQLAGMKVFSKLDLRKGYYRCQWPPKTSPRQW